MFINVKKETFLKNLGEKFIFHDYEEFISVLKEKAITDLKNAISTLSGRELSRRIYDIIPYVSEEECFSMKMFFDKNSVCALEPSYILELIHTGYFHGLISENTRPITRKTKENAVRLKYLEKVRFEQKDISKNFGYFLSFIRNESDYLPSSFVAKRQINLFETTYSSNASVSNAKKVSSVILREMDESFHEQIKEELYNVYRNFFYRAMARYDYTYSIRKKYESEIPKEYFMNLVL